MPNCARCGSTIRAEAKFCPNCGAKIEFGSPEIIAKIEILRKKIDREPFNSNLYLELGNAYRENGLLNEALIEFQKAMGIEGSNVGAYLSTGDIYLLTKDFPKAVASYTKALELDPHLLKAKAGLFWAFLDTEEPMKAIAIGDQLVISGYNDLEFYKSLASLYYEIDRKGDAIKIFEYILHGKPDDIDVLENLAMTLSEMGDNNKALKFHSEILRINPTNVESRLFIAKNNLTHGLYKETVEALTKADDSFSDEFKDSGNLFLASAFINLKDVEKAIANIGKISSHAPDEMSNEDKATFAETNFKIGQEIAEDGNLEAALLYFKHALVLTPTNEKYKEQVDLIDAQIKQRKLAARSRSLKIGIPIIIIVGLAISSWILLHGRIKIAENANISLSVKIDEKKISPEKIDESGMMVFPALWIGSHKILVESDGFEPWAENIKIGWGKTIKLFPRLERTYGTVKIQSAPSNASVFIDDNLIGSTPLINDSVSAKSIFIRLEKKGYISYVNQVVVEKGKTLNLGTVNLTMTETERARLDNEEKQSLFREKVLRQGPYLVRAYNADDKAIIRVNGIEVADIGFKQDSHLIDITKYLNIGQNSIEFILEDYGGGWTYGFQLNKGGNIVWGEECGKAGISGCPRSEGSSHAYYHEEIINIE